MDMENRSQESSLFPQQQAPLPNATAVLVLGILSLVLCFCYGIFGLVCGIIGLVLARKDIALYNANPGFYSISSFNNVKTGRICAIIGISLSAVWFIVIIIYFILFGAAMLSHPLQWPHNY